MPSPKLNFDGTVSPDFKIGKVGPTIHEGETLPASSFGSSGDIFLQIGETPSLHVKNSSLWLPMYHTSLGVVRWEVESGTTFTIPPYITYVGVTAHDNATTTLYLPDTPEGSSITIKDEAGLAGDHPIVVSGSGVIIENAESYSITTSYGSVTLLFVGNGRWIVQATYV